MKLHVILAATVVLAVSNVYAQNPDGPRGSVALQPLFGLIHQRTSLTTVQGDSTTDNTNWLIGASLVTPWTNRSTLFLEFGFATAEASSPSDAFSFEANTDVFSVHASVRFWFGGGKALEERDRRINDWIYDLQSQIKAQEMQIAQIRTSGQRALVRLQQLKEALDSGIITKEEFDEKFQQVIDDL